MSVYTVPGDSQAFALEQWLRDAAGRITFSLYSNNMTPTRSTHIGQLTEAGYPGYARIVLAVPDAVPDYVGEAKCGPFALQFAGPSDGSHPLVYGWYAWRLDDVGGVNLLALARFDGAPITLAGPTSGPFFGVEFIAADFP